MTTDEHAVPRTGAVVGMGTSSDRAPADMARPERAVSAAGPVSEQTRELMREVIARYPKSRSAIMPMLHLVQAEHGYVSPTGIEACAEELGLTPAEVSAVATFYTQYKRRPVGDYHVGVCTNALCAVMGGDTIFAELKEHLGVGNDETTADGKVTLEHVECNAACDFAPVVMVNWEFFDNQTPDSARELVDALRAGREVRSTRGPKVGTFREVSRTLAGFDDGLAGEGPTGGPASLIGLKLAKERGDEAPAPAAADDSGTAAGLPTDADREPTEATATPSSHDAPAETAVSDEDTSATVRSTQSDGSAADHGAQDVEDEE